MSEPLKQVFARLEIALSKSTTVDREKAETIRLILKNGNNGNGKKVKKKELLECTK